MSYGLYMDSKVHTDSNHSHQKIPVIDNKPEFTTRMKLSLSKGTETVRETCANRNANLTEYNLNVPVTTAFSEKILQTEGSISTIYSSEMCSESTENSLISSKNCSNYPSFREEIGSVKTVPIPLDSSKSKDIKIVPNSGTDNAFDQNILNSKIISNAAPSTTNEPIYQTSNLSSESLYSTNANEFRKTLYQTIKPQILVNRNCNNTLIEFLSVLDEWARKGLDKAFNLSMKTTFVDVEKDFQYGLSVIKQMISRIYVLMRAANKLPEPNFIAARKFQRGRNLVRRGLIVAGFAMRHSIDNIELLIIKDLKLQKIVCENISELSTMDVNYMEKIANLNNITANLYTTVISSLLMLRTEMEDFRNIIRAFCSDLERLL